LELTFFTALITYPGSRTTLYLYTSTAAALYCRLGWKKLFEEPYEGEMVDVMCYEA
jgi:hypothetical protein